MTENYLPKQSSIDEACKWLELATKDNWSLKKILEHGVMPWFWLDYKHGLPDVIFGGKIEGYLAPVVFASDVQRIAADGYEALINMSRTHAGEIIKFTPALRFSVDELRFLRDDLKHLATAQNKFINTNNEHTTQAAINSSYIPRTAIGNIAIDAAIQIEQNISRRATNKEVMKLLRKWTDEGINLEYLIRYDEKNKSIIWNTEKSTEAIYTHEACSKTLEKWNKGRK